MKKSRWILLALVIVAAVIVLAALLRSCGKNEQTGEQGAYSAGAEENGDDLGLPMDDSSASGDASALSDGDQAAGDSASNVDPLTGLELEEDELPIIAP